jgi:hypothetical protein
MVYLAGDNNLTPEMVLAMQDMLAEPLPEGDKIVVQFDPSGIGLATQRCDSSLAVPGKPLEAYLDTSYTGAETNTGDARTLADFIEWAIKGTDHDSQYLLILAGHGSGTTEDFLMKDETSADALTIPELKEALRVAQKAIRTHTGGNKSRIDIVGLDACYMAMGEVAYEIRDYADVLIGAEGPEPAYGWPYRRILARAKKLAADEASANADGGLHGSHIDRDVLAKTIVREYVRFYADHDRFAGVSADLAAIDLRRIEGVRTRFEQLVRGLEAPGRMGHDRLLLAHWYAQTYKFEQYVDLKDLCGQLAEASQEHAVASQARAVVDAIDDCIILSGCTGFAYQHSWGLSIYFPWGFVSPDYRKLAFPDETGWYRFLNEHVRATQRAQRKDYPLPSLLPTLKSPGVPKVEAVFAERRRRLEDCHQHAMAERFEGEPRRRAIVSRMHSAMKVRQAGDIGARLQRIVEDIARADIPAEDVPREIAGRLFRVQALGAGRTRYAKYTRYTGDTDDTRSPSARERSVKNLPPVIGKAFFEGRGGKTSLPPAAAGATVTA